MSARITEPRVLEQELRERDANPDADHRLVSEVRRLRALIVALGTDDVGLDGVSTGPHDICLWCSAELVTWNKEGHKDGCAWVALWSEASAIRQEQA